MLFQAVRAVIPALNSKLRDAQQDVLIARVIRAVNKFGRFCSTVIAGRIHSSSGRLYRALPNAPALDVLNTRAVKSLVLITAASLLASGVARAQDPGAVALSVDMGSGSDSTLAPIGAFAPGEITPPTTPDEADSLNGTLYGAEQALDDAPPGPDAQSRSWKVNFHASAGFYHDDNIASSATDKLSDFVSRFTAGGGVTVGDYTTRKDNYLIADYTGIGEVYDRYASDDAFEQSASIEGQALLGHLTFHGDFEFEDLTDDDIDVGTRTRRQVYTGIGSARCAISDKTYVEATAEFIITHYQFYLGSNDERGGIFFHYLPNPEVTLGLGIKGGVLNVQDSGAQTYEQLLSTLEIAATGKLTLQASAGVEDRQTAGDNGLVTPIFELAADYQAVAGLDLSLAAYRHVVNSAGYAGSDYIATGVTAGARYEFSSRFSVLLDAGYANDHYRGVSRDDNYVFLRPTLRYTASTYCTVDLYYFYRDNHSTVAASGFNDTQVGVKVTWTY